MHLSTFLRRLSRSPALAAAAVFGLASLGFTVASLLLAGQLSKVEFGLLTLAMTLMNIGIQIGPAGADGVVNRRLVDFGLPLLRRATWTSALTGTAVLLTAALLYGLDASLALAAAAGAAAGGVNSLAGAKFQSMRRFAISLTLVQSTNLVLFLAALAVAVFGFKELWFPVAIVGGGYLATSASAWRLLLRRARRYKAESFEPFLWAEALAYAGLLLAGLLLSQLERLLIPKILTIETLATFGVLAALALAPFRTLQFGVGYTLLPRLRAAASATARRRLIAHEALTTGAVTVLTAVAIFALTPFVVDLILGGKYHLGSELVVAALISGVLRVVSGFTRAAATALCSTRQLTYLNALMWLCVALAAAAAVLGSRWGLTGVIYGVALGWMSRVMITGYIVLPHLRDGLGREP